MFEVFTQNYLVIGASTCKEKHETCIWVCFFCWVAGDAPKGNYIFVSKNKQQSELKAQKIETGLLLITSEEEWASSSYVCVYVCVWGAGGWRGVTCSAYCLSTPLPAGGGGRHFMAENKSRAARPTFKKVQYALHSSFSSQWWQQRGWGEGWRDSSRFLLTWGQRWRSVLFIHYFIEKMSILWFGPSEDWFVQRGYTPPCWIRWMEVVRQQTQQIMLTLFKGPLNHQLCPILTLNTSCRIYLVYKIRTDSYAFGLYLIKASLVLKDMDSRS